MGVITKRSIDRSVEYGSRLPEAHHSPVSHINLPRAALAALCCGTAFGCSEYKVLSGRIWLWAFKGKALFYLKNRFVFFLYTSLGDSKFEFVLELSMKEPWPP